jgi:asparagine synthase (glutamine-hydrolysing)
MCGIATLIEPAAPEWLVATVQRMTRLVRHRGPDGEGCAFLRPGDGTMTPLLTEETPGGVTGSREALPGATLGLGHRRLSILDLSTAGHQPMRDAAGECWITYNGEIYNYVELRAELAAAGHAFHTGTDTEVILAAWREWGERCLARFNGMFAFALFDRRTRRLFAARDRFGVKPLYLWSTPTGGLALASEVKQFTAHPHWSARVNGQRAYDFLNWGLSDHTGETLFASVRQLRGGEFLLTSLEAATSASPQRWYELRPAPFARGSMTRSGCDCGPTCRWGRASRADSIPRPSSAPCAPSSASARRPGRTRFPPDRMSPATTNGASSPTSLPRPAPSIMRRYRRWAACSPNSTP